MERPYSTAIFISAAMFCCSNFMKAQLEAAGYTVDLQYANNDVATQVSQLENMVGIWQGFWIAYVRIPAFIVTLSGQLVFRGCTLLLLNGMTLAPFPNDYLMFSTGFIAKEAKVDILGMNMNIVCLITGIVIALVFCILQIVNNATRRRKGYEAESSLSLAVKLVLISAVLIWFFALLAQYQGIPTVLVILGVLLVVYTFITTKTVAGRHLYALGGNEKAARLSGVKTNRLFFLAYVNMQFVAWKTLPRPSCPRGPSERMKLYDAVGRSHATLSVNRAPA